MMFVCTLDIILVLDGYILTILALMKHFVWLNGEYLVRLLADFCPGPQQICFTKIWILVAPHSLLLRLKGFRIWHFQAWLLGGSETLSRVPLVGWRVFTVWHQSNSRWRVFRCLIAAQLFQRNSGISCCAISADFVVLSQTAYIYLKGWQFNFGDSRM